MKITSSLACIAVSILAAVAFNSANAANVLIDPMDALGNWQLGGGNGAIDRTLTVDNSIFSEGTGSLKLQAAYQAGGNAYADMYENVPAVDLSGSPFSFNFDLLSSSTNVSLVITLGSSHDDKYFNASFTPTITGGWENVKLDLSSFGMISSDLTSIDFARFRVIGDGLGSFPQTVSVNIDNLRVVPEPASWSMVAGGFCLLGVMLWLRHRPVLPLRIGKN